MDLFKIKLGAPSLQKIGEPKYLHQELNPEYHGKPVVPLEKCKDVDEVNELATLCYDEEVTIDTGLEFTIQIDRELKVLLESMSEFQPPFKVNFRLTSWVAANEAQSREYIDSFQDGHFGYDMIELEPPCDYIRRTSNNILAEWERPDKSTEKESDSKIVFKCILKFYSATDLLPRKFGSPVYLVISISRNIQIYSRAYKINIILGSKLIQQPTVTAKHELKMKQFNDTPIPQYVWDYEVGNGRFICIVYKQNVAKDKGFCCYTSVGESMQMKIYPVNFTRAYSTKNLKIMFEVVPSIDEPLLERYEELRKPVIQVNFDETSSLKYIRSYEYGLLYFAVNWKHSIDPEEFFSLSFKFNASNEDLYGKGSKKKLKLNIKISYDGKVIDDAQSIFLVASKPLTPQATALIVEDCKHLERTTNFRSLMPVKLFCFLNLCHEKLKTDVKYVPCILHDLSRQNFFSQILELINSYEIRSLVPLKVKDIIQLRLDDQILIHREDKEFVPLPFTIANKSIFDVKFKISRIKDAGLPESLQDEKLLNAIRNTELCTRTVVQIQIITAYNNENIQKSLDKIDYFSHTFN